MWNQQVLTSQQNGEMKIIYFGLQALKRLDYNMIPALAAIALRVAPEELLDVVKHHNITVDDVNYVSFPWCIAPPPIAPEPGDDQLLSPSEWPVLKAFVDAMTLDDELTANLEAHLRRFQDGDEFEVACLLSSKPRLWAKSQLTEHFDLRRNGKALGIPCPRVISADTLKDVGVKFDELSDDEVLSLLDRSGNLLPDVDAENGFLPIETSGFFQLLFGVSKNTGNYKRMIEAINRAEDPKMISSIADRILAAIPDFANRDSGEGVQFLESMRESLDQDRYGHVFDSVVIKLGVLPIHYMANVKNERYEQAKSLAQREFCEAGNRIFKLLDDELKDLAPNAWRKRHFAALGTLISEWNVHQDLTGVDLQGLLIKTLSALEAYKAAEHQNYVGAKIHWCAEEAEGHAKKLAQFVSKTIDIDYERLAALPSASKALLVSLGLDLRKLPGINNRDKGALLSEGLGL
jgi:hypothetical protein